MFVWERLWYNRFNISCVDNYFAFCCLWLLLHCVQNSCWAFDNRICFGQLCFTEMTRPWSDRCFFCFFAKRCGVVFGQHFFACWLFWVSHLALSFFYFFYRTFLSSAPFWVYYCLLGVFCLQKCFAFNENDGNTFFSAVLGFFLLFFQKSLKFMDESVLRKPLIYMYIFSPPDLLFFAFFFTMFFFSEEFMLSGLTAPFFFVVVDTLLEKLFVSLP